MFDWKEGDNMKLLGLLESSDVANIQLAIMMAHGNMGEDEFIEFIIAANGVLSGSDFHKGDWSYIIETIPVVRLISRGYSKLNDEALDIWFSVKGFRENCIGTLSVKKHLEYNSYSKWNRYKIHILAKYCSLNELDGYSYHNPKIKEILDYYGDWHMLFKKRLYIYNQSMLWWRDYNSFNSEVAEIIVAEMIDSKEKDTEVLSTIIRNLPSRTSVGYLNRYGILYYLKYSAYPRKNLRVFKELYYNIMSNLPKSYRSKIISI